MRRAFAVLATVQVLAVVGQFFLAASGAFDTAPNDESFQPHRALGAGILLLALVVTIVAAIARVPGRLIGLSGLVAGLALVQFVIATHRQGVRRRRREHDRRPAHLRPARGQRSGHHGAVRDGRPGQAPAAGPARRASAPGVMTWQLIVLDDVVALLGVAAWFGAAWRRGGRGGASGAPGSRSSCSSRRCS